MCDRCCVAVQHNAPQHPALSSKHFSSSSTETCRLLGETFMFYVVLGAGTRPGLSPRWMDFWGASWEADLRAKCCSSQCAFHRHMRHIRPEHQTRAPAHKGAPGRPPTLEVLCATVGEGMLRSNCSFSRYSVCNLLCIRNHTKSHATSYAKSSQVYT